MQEKFINCKNHTMLYNKCTLLLTGLLLIGLSACWDKQQDFTDISGRIIEKGSNKGVADAQVVFYQCISGGIGQGSLCEPIDTISTDANGYYQYTMENDETVSYHIEAYKPNYTMQTLQIAQGGRTTKKADIVLLPHAWIKFHVKNVNPVDENDFIIAPGSTGTGSYYFYGKSVDTTYLLGNRVGNLFNKIDWYTNKNNTYRQYLDSIFCKPLDTTFYEIKY